MATQASLSAASNDRKAKLARLKSLKQKQAPTSQDADEHRDVGMSGQEEATGSTSDAPTDEPPATSRKRSRSPSPTTTTPAYLSGRNYDAATRGPKLGFETAPDSKAQTVEVRAQQLAEETKRQREEEEKADKPLDLFKLQPKKPNWDLKRDLEKKLKVLDVRTDNAIARMVRERVLREKEAEKRKALNGKGAEMDGEDGEVVGMEGVTLVEAMHQREREEQEDERRERTMEEEDVV